MQNTKLAPGLSGSCQKFKPLKHRSVYMLLKELFLSLGLVEENISAPVSCHQSLVGFLQVVVFLEALNDFLQLFLSPFDWSKSDRKHSKRQFKVWHPLEGRIPPHPRPPDVKSCSRLDQTLNFGVMMRSFSAQCICGKWVSATTTSCFWLFSSTSVKLTELQLFIGCGSILKIHPTVQRIFC